MAAGRWVSASHCTTSFHETPIGLLTLNRSCAKGLPCIDKNGFPWIATYFDAQCLYPKELAVELLVDAENSASQRGQLFQVVTHHEWNMNADGELVFFRRSVQGVEKHTAVDSFTVRPDAIVNATGAWVDQTLSGLSSVMKPMFMPPTQVVGSFVEQKEVT